MSRNTWHPNQLAIHDLMIELQALTDEHLRADGEPIEKATMLVSSMKTLDYLEMILGDELNRIRAGFSQPERLAYEAWVLDNG